MHDARLSWYRDLTVRLDYGQFYLSTDDHDPDLAPELVGPALTAGIAQRDVLTVVVSPHQNNFAMPLRVEVWTAAPPDDLDEWEEAFEAHLDIGEAGLVYESPTVDVVRLPVPSGRYHALITGRGFDGHGWPGSTTPGDAWRIRCWPSSGPTRPARLRAYVGSRFEHPAPAHAHDGVAAAGRIHRALDDVSAMSGERGTVTVQRVMPGTRRTLFSKFRYLHGWLTSSAVPGEDGFTMCGYTDHPTFGDADQIVPDGGDIHCEVRAMASPSHVEFAWTWIRRPPDRRSSEENRDLPGGPIFRLLPEMSVRFELANAEPDPQWPNTLVTVVHHNVPAELVDDLSAYWRWALERGDYDFDLSGARARHARRDGVRR